MASSVCRVCLVGNIRLVDMDAMHLHVLEKLTDSKVDTESDGGMPSTVCYVCHRQLQRCHLFSEMARHSLAALRDMLHRGIEITCSTTAILSPAMMPTLTVNHTHHVFVIQHTNDASTPENDEQLLLKTEAIAGTVFVESHQTSDEDAQQDGSSDNTESYGESEQADAAPAFSCDVCNKQFLYKHHLVKHLESHTRTKVNPEQCDPLPLMYPRQKHRPHIVLPSSCSVCKKVFILKASLARHMQLHTGGKLHACRVCGAAFTHETSLTTHVMQTHTGEKPFSCTICNKKFSYKYSLSIHSRLHSGERPYLCTRCDKTFIMKINLIKHMRSHTGEKPYSCTKCDKVFSDNSNLRRHIVRIHTQLKSYSCTTCDKTYNNENTLKRHMESHAEEELNICSVCGKTFALRSSLARHMRSHAVPAPAPAPAPAAGDDSYTRKEGALKQHMPFQYAEKPYACTKCNMAFTYKVSLRLHMQLHAGEKS